MFLYTRTPFGNRRYESRDWIDSLKTGMASTNTEATSASSGSNDSSNKDISLIPQEVDDTDYGKVYEELQLHFHEVYTVSQRLAVTEKAQRQTLYSYRRKIDALLDYMAELEGRDEEPIEQPLDLDSRRIEEILQKKPELKLTLEPLLQIAQNELPANIKFKKSYNANLAVDELIPDIRQDELDTVEVNPQETEMWVRRNYPHLVVSKFKPVEIRGKDVREYNDPNLLAPKKKRRTNSRDQ